MFGLNLLPNLSPGLTICQVTNLAKGNVKYKDRWEVQNEVLYS